MYWQEDAQDTPFEVPDDVVDVLFSIRCARLPVDHAFALSMALRELAPWLADEARAGIHALHVAGSQNGWERPEHDAGQFLIPSRRSKLAIRIPIHRLDDLTAALNRRTLDIHGCELTIGEPKTRGLSKETTLFARYVAGDGDTEEAFLQWVVAALRHHGIRIRKALCGKEARLSTPDGPIITRSLMLADLSREESVALQRDGLGPHRAMGCGIFLPHKGIDSVKHGG